MKVMAHGLKGGTSFMEDYTYHFDPAGPAVLGAHMLEICPSIAEGKPSCEVHPLGIGGKEDPVRLVFDSADRRRRQRLGRRHGQPLPHDRQHGEGRAAAREAAEAAGRPRPVGTASRASPSPPPPGFTPAAPTTPASPWRLTPEHLEDFAAMAGIEFLLIDGETKLREFKNELRWNDAAYMVGPALR